MKSEIISVQAYKAFKKGSYILAITLLEKHIHSSTNPYDYFILILSYLLTDKLVQAESLLRTSLKRFPSYLPLLEINAFLQLKAAKSKEEACKGYAEILKLHPTTRRIAKIVKKIQNAKDFEIFQKRARLKEFVAIQPPPRTSRLSLRSTHYASIVKKIIIVLLALVSIVIIIQFSSPLVKLIEEKAPLFSKLHNTQYHDERISHVNIEGMHYEVLDKMTRTKTPEFYATAEECISDFNRAKWLIKEKKENEALRILNKIEMSNAHFRVKERVNFLKDIIMQGERTVAAYSYAEIAQKPYLYRGVKIKWSGKVVNYKKRNNAYTFQLLINFENDKFDGLVEVYSSLVDVSINNGAIVTVEGIITNVISQKIIILQATHIDTIQ